MLQTLMSYYGVLEVGILSLNRYDMSINDFEPICDMVNQLILLVLRESCMCTRK